MPSYRRENAVLNLSRPQEFIEVFGNFFKTLKHVFKNSQRITLSEMETFLLVSIAKTSSRCVP